MTDGIDAGCTRFKTLPVHNLNGVPGRPESSFEISNRRLEIHPTRSFRFEISYLRFEIPLRTPRTQRGLPSAELATLADGHGAEFPYDLATNIPRFGPGLHGHNSADMPIRRSIFHSMDNYNQAAAQKRIKCLCDDLVSLREK